MDVSDQYLSWLNDERVNQYLESRHQDHSIDSLNEFVSDATRDSNSAIFKIVTIENSEHIGNIKLGPVDWIHRFADVGILIGNTECHGKGVGTEAITLVRDYAFNNLKLNKLIAQAYEPNVGSIKAFLKSGFNIEGKFRSKFLYKDHYISEVLLGCNVSI